MAKAKGKAPSSSPPPPLTPTSTTQFGKDLKRFTKRGKDVEKLRAVIEALCAREILAARHRDHALGGDWKGWRDCHVEADWLLIYKSTATELILGRTGTHSDLFDE